MITVAVIARPTPLRRGFEVVALAAALAAFLAALTSFREGFFDFLGDWSAALGAVD
jgi:hypothetical protein